MDLGAFGHFLGILSDGLVHVLQGLPVQEFSRFCIGKGAAVCPPDDVFESSCFWIVADLKKGVFRSPSAVIISSKLRARCVVRRSEEGHVPASIPLVSLVVFFDLDAVVRVGSRRAEIFSCSLGGSAPARHS